jgi:hypothetical protein
LYYYYCMYYVFVCNARYHAQGTIGIEPYVYLSSLLQYFNILTYLGGASYSPDMDIWRKKVLNIFLMSVKLTDFFINGSDTNY